MSYLVLARKYRPQSFSGIVGQEHVTRTLANAFAKQRVHHAFLFCGPRGVGKTTAARVLAKALCCAKGPTADPCGECDPCQTITAGTAVDYFEIDGASNNSVDNIRELRDGVRYQPAQLRRKVYVIDEVHMLSTAAFNALLKTLEEPPPHVTFIFATTEVHKIPVTILSRCQRYDFKLVPQARLLAHVERIFQAEGIRAERSALALLAREAGGSVRDMLSLADQVIAYTSDEAMDEAKVAEVLGVADRALLRDLARSVLSNDMRGALVCVDSALSRGVDLAHLARSFLGTLRDLVVVKDVREPEGLVDATPDELEALGEQAKGASRAHLIALFDRMTRACEDLARSSTPRLVLEIALVDMGAIEPLLSISDMVERLESLEGRLRGESTGRASGAPPRLRTQRGVSADNLTDLSGRKPNETPSLPEAPERKATEPAEALDSMGEWERVILALEKKSMALAGIYAQAQLLGWSETRIELGFPANSLQGSLGADTDNIAGLKKFLAGFLGRTLDVAVKTIQGICEKPGGGESGGALMQAPTSVAEVERSRLHAERVRREEEARSHPSTQAVLKAFGASIKEIKVDG
ncbi:MAG: DNA polymerase III subunit gamma/tau [Deltaproteobacteria bacterium]|nr:DNA polymerase III subunit gamma/tau [Deltaproteobacteria bacterium]